MTKSEEIQSVIAEAERKIKSIVKELEATHGIGVNTIIFGSPQHVNEIELGEVCLGTFRIAEEPELDNGNASFDEWVEEVRLQSAYVNLPFDGMGGPEELRRLYEEGETPADAVDAAWDINY